MKTDIDPTKRVEQLGSSALFTPFCPQDLAIMIEAGCCACGQAALAAALERDVKGVIKGFIGNPGLWVSASLMVTAAATLGFTVRKTDPFPHEKAVMLVQGLGSWMNPGVPLSARNARTHWVATCRTDYGTPWVYDVNIGDWLPASVWESDILADILEGWKAKAWNVRTTFVLNAGSQIKTPVTHPNHAASLPDRAE